jgi:hypothetical protein
MILFKKDWAAYPGSIIDVRTKNQTFLRLAALYRDLGISNNSFLLALHNPELQGIDPHSEDLTEKQMAMIAIEISENPWYFFREVIRIPMVGSPIPSEFKAHRGNIALYWLFFNHIFVILEQIRQTGKSVGCDCLHIYNMNGGTTNTQVNIITKDDTLRTNNLARLKEMQDLLPWYLNFRTRNDIANTEMMTIKALTNEIRAHVPNKSPKAAYKIGRGLTSPIFQIDEAAFIDNIAIILPSALAAGTAARELAKQNHQPYGTILTTTAGKKDDPEGGYVYNMIQESAIWTEHMLDAENHEELEDIIRKNSSANARANLSEHRGKGVLRVYASFTHKQLGKTDEWLARSIEDANVKGEDADRDFFGVWTSGSILSPFTAQEAARMRASEQSTYHQVIMKPGAYIVRWYIPEQHLEARMNHGKFIMALDTSDAAGGDDIGMLIRDIETGAVVAAGTYNETNLILFADWLVNFLHTYQNVTLIPERKSSAITIIDYLLIKMPAVGMDPFKRIYNTIVQNSHEDKDAYNRIAKPMHVRGDSLYVEYKKSFGFVTSGSGLTSRSELYSTTLTSAVKYTGDTIHDKKTIDQILSLMIKNGRVDHPQGGHDDMAISWLLSYWLMIHGRKLDHYGINSAVILSMSTTRAHEVSSGNAYDNQYQQYIQAEIDRISEEIKKERDDFIAYKLENRLKNLFNEMTSYGNSAMSVDDMIKQVQKERSMRQRTKMFR